MNEILYTFLVILGTSGVFVGYWLLSKKFNLKKDDSLIPEIGTEMLLLILKKEGINFSNKELLVKILEYVKQSIDMIQKQYETDDVEEYKDIVFANVREILVKENIEIDMEMIDLVSQLVDIFI